MSSTDEAVLILLLAVFLQGTLALFTGAAIIPHGDFAYDPEILPQGSPEREAAREVAVGSRGGASMFESEASPDIVLLSTPHGIKLERKFSMFMGKSGEGTSVIGDDMYNPTHTYNISAKVAFAPDIAQDLLKFLQTRQQNVSGIYGFDDERPMPLQWGEIIPISIMDNSCVTPNPKRRYIIWSVPERRYDYSQEMVPELLRIGALMRRWIEVRPERIAIVISGDMSHTHEVEGPYGYSNASAPFDEAVGKWASSPERCGSRAANILLKTASSLQKDAMSCGFTGFVMLHGILCAAPFALNEFEGRVWANRNATYYGMMSATFLKRNGGGGPTGMLQG